MSVVRPYNMRMAILENDFFATSLNRWLFV